MKARSNFRTERLGVNYARTIVENAGNYFKEVNLQHDVGHDATITIVVDGVVRPREIALQIKSGASYISDDLCKLPASAPHVYFWAKHDLTTLGVVYDPSEKTAYWLNLKMAASKFYDSKPKSGTTFTFAKMAWNRFDADQFSTVVVPMLLGEPPSISLETVCAWIASNDPETHELGILVLRARHFQQKTAWDCLIDVFLSRATGQLSPEIAIALAKLLGHDDIGYYSDQIPADVRKAAIARVLAFGPAEIAKLLAMMDDHDFDRPSFGYSLMPLWGQSEKSRNILATVAEDTHLDHEVQQRAAVLLSWYHQDPEWWAFWRRDGDKVSI